MERIEAYTDFRKFLADFYQDKKGRVKGFSHRQFCLKAGLTSPSYLKEVIDGRRNLTDATVPQFVKALDLTDLDASFFAVLVRFNQSVDPVMKQQYIEQMRSLRRKIPAVVVPLDRYDYYSRWYHPVLRELATQKDWGDRWIDLARAVRPWIRAREAREGVELLERLGFLRREGDRWVQSDPVITTGGDVDSLAVRAGNREYARLGMESIEDLAPSRRDVSTMIVGIPPSALVKIRQEIREFKQRVARIARESSEGGGVFALNVQFFPLSEEEK